MAFHASRETGTLKFLTKRSRSFTFAAISMACLFSASACGKGPSKPAQTATPTQVLPAGTTSAAGTVTAVETLGIITANQASNGLGFNLDAEQDWQWAAAAAAGATHARIQCSWEQVEQQSAPPDNNPGSPQYVQTPNCAAGLASAKKYGIHPTVVAAYGSPHHVILTVAVPNGAQVGDTSFEIAFVAGTGGATFNKLAVPYDYFGFLPYGRPSAVGPYYGTFITGIQLKDNSHAVISLASALTSPLPADNTQYAISEVLYPSAASFSPDDPSVVAYGNYVSFLASSIAAAGLTGEVELWNEPPSAGLDPWDKRYAAYDPALLPAGITPGDAMAPNFGFVANLQSRKLPAGVTLTWNGTSGDGSSSMLAPNMLAFSGATAMQPANVVTRESFHPYGGPYSNPEDVLWSQPCLTASVAAGTDFTKCSLAGERQGPNNIYEAYLDTVAKAQNAAGGIGRSVTETNILAPGAGFAMQQARFDVRQYLGLQAVGYTPVEFYKLYDADTTTDPNFSFVQQIGSTALYNPKQNYNAISLLMAYLSTIRQLPVQPYPATALTSVSSFSGSYPLSTVHMVGARLGAMTNSDLFVVWQRSMTPCSGSSCTGNWMTLASPGQGSVVALLPAGGLVTSVVDLVTGAPVLFTVIGRQLTLTAADDPIAIMVDQLPLL